jgi:hypothetical protein
MQTKTAQADRGLRETGSATCDLLHSVATICGRPRMVRRGSTVRVRQRASAICRYFVSLSSGRSVRVCSLREQ